MNKKEALTKMLYHFTLVLDGVDKNTLNLEDILYSAGCDDSLINFRNGNVYLDFDREAPSLEQAIIKTIKQVETSYKNAIIICVASDNFATVGDIAKQSKDYRHARNEKI